MRVLCTCGREIHVGSIVGTTAGVGGPLMPGGPVTGVIAVVRYVVAREAMNDVFPPVPGVDAYTSVTLLITSERSYPSPGRGEYVSAVVTPALVARGCASL